jgi:hypothetical protein
LYIFLRKDFLNIGKKYRGILYGPFQAKPKTMRNYLRPRLKKTSFVIIVLVLSKIIALPSEVSQSGSVAVQFNGLYNDYREKGRNGSKLYTMPISVEAAYKISADINEHLSVNIKSCIGCHGVELDQAYGSAYINDYLNIDAGRINVPFGSFNESHDPANYKMATKPLPYMMGHMVRQDEFNLGVVPMPFVDNGISVYGTVWPADRLSIFYVAYVINGFHSFSNHDLNWSAKWTGQQNIGGARQGFVPGRGGAVRVHFWEPFRRKFL